VLEYELKKKALRFCDDNNNETVSGKNGITPVPVRVDHSETRERII
jgi:hypothetical protein